MAEEERRQAQRLGFKLAVMIRSGPVSEQVETADVALRGVFVVVDRPRPEKSLVSLTIKLPDGSGLNVNGMVARVVSRADSDALGVPAGMGIQFYGLGKKSQDRWETFIAKEGLIDAPTGRGLDASTTQPDAAPAGVYVIAGDAPAESHPRVELRPTPPLRLAGADDAPAEETDDEDRDLGESPSQVHRSLVIIDPNEQPEAARARLGVPSTGPTAAMRARHRRAPDDTEESLSAVVDEHEPYAEDGKPTVPDVDEPPPIPRPAAGLRVPSPAELGVAPAHVEPEEPTTVKGAPSEEEPDDDDDELPTEARRPAPAVPAEGLEADEKEEPRTTARGSAPPGTDAYPEPKTEVSDLRPPRRPPPPPLPMDSAPPPATASRGQPGPASDPGGAFDPGGSALGARGLAPKEPEGFALYRLSIPTVHDLEAFAETALRSRGVFVRTQDIRPSGTAAVVCVVHPLSGDEFHLPGEVVPTSGARPGVAVGFARVTERTILDFRTFIALGIPDEDIDGAPTEHDWRELTITERAEDRPAGGQAAAAENTHEVDISDLEPFDGD